MPIRWRLAALLADRRMTGYALAKATGISVPTCYQLLRKRDLDRIDAHTLDTLCRVLECQPGDLLEHRKR